MIAIWQQNCVLCLECMHDITQYMARASGVARVRRQLEQLGVWQLVGQLVEATGAPPAARLLCWRSTLQLLCVWGCHRGRTVRGQMNKARIKSKCR